MKIRHIENGDIDYFSSLFRIKREQLYDRLLNSKGRFNDDLFYIVYNEISGKNEGAFALSGIDHKNRHLVVHALPQTKEMLDIASRYAFAQFDLNKVYIFSDTGYEGFTDEGVFRGQSNDAHVYSINK